VIARSWQEVAEDRSWGREIGAHGVCAHWLINATGNETGEGGLAGILEIEPGGELPPHRHPDVETVALVLEGTASVTHSQGTLAATPGTVIFAAAGAWHGVAVDAGPPCRLFAVLTTARGPAEVAWERPAATGALAGPRLAIIDMSAAPEVRMHDPDDGRYNIHARWLVDRDHAGSASLVFGQCTFFPHSLHATHRHPGAAELLYVYEGAGEHLTEHGSIPQRAGELVYVPRGEWHGLRGSPDGPLHAVFAMLAVASGDEAGYELHPASAASDRGGETVL
jgi:quercetin dioxygenase-like cupin family protein